MAKFLIINQPPPHPTKRARVGECVNYFNNLNISGRARVFPIVGLKGYATIVDVDSHEALGAILAGNPMGHIEQYRILAIRELKG